MSMVDVKIPPFAFYNPKGCMLSLEISMVSGCIQLKLAQSLNKDTQMSRDAVIKYDHKNSAYFSINFGECVDLYEVLPKILNGTYINPDPRCEEKYKTSFVFTHYKDNSPSRLVIAPVTGKDKSGQEFKTIRIIIFPSNPATKDIYMYTLRKNELKLFIEFINRGFTFLPFVSQCIHGVIKAIRKAGFENAKKQKAEGNSSDAPASYYSNSPQTNNNELNNLFSDSSSGAMVESAPSSYGSDDTPPWEQSSSSSNEPPAVEDDPFNLAF